MEHDERYERAMEWLEVIKRLWTREEEFDFEGRFYGSRRAGCSPSRSRSLIRW
jgi:dimethylsulfone monooxygenase